MRDRVAFPAIILLLSSSCLYAQREKQIDTLINHYHPLIPLDKGLLLKNIDVIANMRFGESNEFQDGTFERGHFNMDQFRLEIRGKVYDKVYFRFRDRYTRDPVTQSVDNISRSTDLAYIRIDATPKWSFSMGKLCADWGGYEFDFNPIDIYEYNDIIEYADNFLSGVQAGYKVSANQEFNFQMLNSRTKTFAELYDTIPGVTESKFPVALVGNWRGTFAGGKFTTLWSASFFQEAQKKDMNYIALGNQLNLNKWNIIYDFKWSNEGLDRKTIVTSIVPKSINPYAAEDVRYVEHWLRLEYRFHEKWSASVIGMVSDAYWYGNPDPHKNDHLRTAWGLIPVVEYFPFKDLPLKFFLNYVGRFYDYTTYARQKFGAVNSTYSRIEIGFVTPLKIL